jgi:uncharacterized protein (TIGR02647 family)
MKISDDLYEELVILNLFDLDTTQGGLKIHTDAGENKVLATKRLFDKGMLSQQDGGYLTDRGLETAEHAQLLVKLLQA